jgi:hypothetical protein
MEDYTVRVISIKQVPVVGADLRFKNHTRVSIMVGDHGAFTKDFAPGADSPEAINAWKQEQANAVRAITGN